MTGGLGVLLLAIIGSPLFLIICAGGILGFATMGEPVDRVTGDMVRLVAMDTLITIPLFTFAGYLLAESNAPKRLVRVSQAMFGWFPGGMAIVVVITCAFFTTFTGASGITIVALGGLLLPVLLKQGYSRDFSLGLVTTSGSRGLTFPPSLPVIIYGCIAGVEITALYIAGIVPGLINLGAIAIYCVFVGFRSKVPKTDFDGPEAAKALWNALPEVLLPFWLIGLILTGILTVPEAAAMAALYVLIVEVFVYRDIHIFRDLPRVTKESMVLCGAILVILGASLGLTNYLVQAQVPKLIVETIETFIHSKYMFLLALNVFLLVVGCMMDIFSAIVVVVPLITPLAAQFGINPIHLAIIFLINLELGYNTPPVGMNLFIASFRFRQPVIRLYRAAWTFVLISLASLLVITYIEPISTFTVAEGKGVVEGGFVQHKKTPEQLKADKDKLDAKKAPAVDDKKKGQMDGVCNPAQANDPDCDDDIDIDDDDDEPAGDTPKAGTKPAAKKPAMDGLCDKAIKDDPDCEDVDLDLDLDD
jgi:C4-dicarboxylate transporter, DctM subunit